MKKLLLLILSISLIKMSFGFETLNDALRYAAYYPENVPPTNPELMHSDYDQFHHTIKESWWQHTLLLLGFSQRPVIHRTEFLQQLEQLTKSRELSGFTQNFAVKINFITPTLSIYAWGPIYGQFHSLVTCLKSLHDDKVIDEHFVIQPPNTYFIFDGNMINNSPYNIETLFLLFQILKKNPTTAFYISGNYESEHLWLNFTLKQELNTRFSPYFYGLDAFEQLLNRFFSTLPLAVYVQLICHPQNFIRFSYFNRQYPLINEKYCDGLTEISYENGISICKFQNPKNTPVVNEKPLIIKTVIVAEDRLINYKLHGGLIQREPYLESTVWTLFSAPTYKYRKFFEFYNDAFAHIAIHQQAEQSTIALYAQDVRERHGLKQVKNFNLVTGQSIAATTPGAPSQEPLYVGCTLDLSRSIAQQGEMLRRGIMLRINQINENGGINGRQITMIFMDDGYTPERARANMQDFIKKYKGFITLSSTGSPTLSAYLDLVKNQQLFVFFPSTGLGDFRDPELKNIINWPLIREYQDLITKANAVSTPFTLEGFISASLMVDILQKIEGDITSESINKALESIKNYTYKGMALNFDASTRSIANYLWLYLERDKWLTIQNREKGAP